MNDQTASTSPATADLEANENDLTDSVLQRAVWMAGDLGIDMPPVPGVYFDTLQEIVPGQIFATDPALLAFDTAGNVTEALATHWPKAGLAFGFTVRGSRARWFYSLVSASQILTLSLGIDLADADDRRISLAIVNAAHRQLETFLANNANYQRAIAQQPPGDLTARPVTVFSDASGQATEIQALWRMPDGLSDFAEKPEIFLAEKPEIPEVERIIWA